MSSIFGIDQLKLDPEASSALRAFVRAWKDHAKPVLFAGAGLSMNAKPKPRKRAGSQFSSWTTLIEALKDELSSDDKDLRSRLPQDPLRLAQVYESPARRGLLLDRIAEHVPSADFVPGAVHRKLARLPWAAIVTTNYDDLIERAFMGSRSVRKVIWDLDLTQRRTPDDLLVIKMHGDLADRKSIVFTEEDYRTYDATRPGLAVKIRQLLLEHPLMFVGFSLSDPNFGAIDGWIRDTVRQVRLPAVAIMHGPAVPAESHMWKTRGIELVRFPDTSSDHLERLCDALKGERDLRSGSDARPAETDRMAAIRQKIREILVKRHEAATWPTDVAALISQAITGVSADKRDREDATNLIVGFCHGHLGHLDGPLDLAPVYEALLQTHRRPFLLFAHDAGQIVFTPDGKKRIDLSAALLEDESLSPDERARVHLTRGVTHRDQGLFKEAMGDFSKARQFAESEALRTRISEELHEALFLAGDPQEIEAELTSSVDYGDVFALCRRGAQALLLRQPEKAEGWYASALNVATSSDEEFVALWGLRVARARGAPWEFADDEGVRLALAEIPEDERPGSKKIFDLTDQAGRELLSGNRVAAIATLKEYLHESRKLGWPHSVSHSISFPMEIAAEQMVDLLLSKDSDGSEPESSDVRAGLAVLVQFGLARKVDKLFKHWILSQLASRGDEIEWFRQFVGAARGIPRSQDARHAVAIAGLPVLGDACITEEITRLVDETIHFIDERKAGKAGLTETLDDRWKCVRVHCEHLPAGAVISVVKAIERAIPDGYVCSTIGVGRLSWALWAQADALRATSPEIDRIVAAIALQLPPHKDAPNPFSWNEFVGLVHGLSNGGLLSDENKARLAPGVAGVLEQQLTANDAHRSFIDAANLALLLDPNSKILLKVPEQLVSSQATIAHSSLMPAWCHLAARVLDRCTGDQVERVRQIASDYAAACCNNEAYFRSWLLDSATGAVLLIAIDKQDGNSLMSPATVKKVLEIVAAHVG